MDKPRAYPPFKECPEWSAADSRVKQICVVEKRNLQKPRNSHGNKLIMTLQSCFKFGSDGAKQSEIYSGHVAVVIQAEHRLFSSVAVGQCLQIETTSVNRNDNCKRKL